MKIASRKNPATLTPREITKLKKDYEYAINSASRRFNNVLETNLIKEAHDNYRGMLRALETDLKHNITGESLTKLTPARIKNEINKSIGGRTIEQRLKLNARNLYQDATKALQKDILAAIKEHQAQGHSIDKMTRTIKGQLHTDTYKARRIARTESHRMREFSTWEAQTEAQKYEMFKREWLATMDMRTRPEHLALGGKFEGEDGRFHYGEWATYYPGGFGVAKMDIHCFTGDTLIYLDTPIKTMYKQLYEGEFVTIKTAGGVEVTGTFNHPVYTSRGWIILGELKKTDKVGIIRDVSRFKPKDINTVSTFKEVYDFAASIFFKGTGSVGMDFHGYIPKHEVDVIFTNGFLGAWVKLLKCLKNWELMRSLFVQSDLSNLSVFYAIFKRILIATPGRISGFCKGFSILGFHTQKHSVRASTLFNPGFSNNNIPGATEELSSSLDGIRGIIEFDDILSLDISIKSCHVYNLQSVNNYYFVNSASHKDIGLLVHNCRCTTVANFDDVMGDPNFIRHGDTQQNWENDILDIHSRYNKDKLIMETLDPKLYPFDVATGVSAEMEQYMELSIGEFEMRLKMTIRDVYHNYLKAEYSFMDIKLIASHNLDPLYVARQQKIFKGLAKAYPEAAKRVKVLQYTEDAKSNSIGYMQPYRGTLNINTHFLGEMPTDAIKSGWFTPCDLEFTQTDRALVHEYGHWVDWQDGEWASKGKVKPRTMTGYGTTNNQEAFAESFVEAVTAETPDPLKVKFIERSLGRGIKEVKNLNLEVLV